MNYTVDLQSSANFAPQFAEHACFNEDCFCADSLSPIDWLRQENQLSQNITIYEAFATYKVWDSISKTFLDREYYPVTYRYRSGLCFEVEGSVDFSKTHGDTTVFDGESCFKKQDLIMKQEQVLKLKVLLFERYPDQVQTWVQENGSPVANYGGTAGTFIYRDELIENAVVTIQDYLGDTGNPQVFKYNTTLSLQGLSQVKRAIGLDYNLTALNPQPASPFDNEFRVDASRRDSGGVSAVYNPWYIAGIHQDICSLTMNNNVNNIKMLSTLLLHHLLPHEPIHVPIVFFLLLLSRC